MSTNDDEPTTEAPAEVTQSDEELRQALQTSIANDTKSEAADTETAPNAETAEVTAEVPTPPETTLTTEPDHDLDWYKTAYPESTKEALRLKKENDDLKAERDKKVETPPAPEVPAPPVADEVLTPEQLYIRGKQIEESDAAFALIRDKYPALQDQVTYDKFVTESRALGAFIVQDQKRFPSPNELYEKTAVILGLTPDNSEAIGSAVKNAAGAPRTSSAPASPPPPSKVTEEHIAMNLKMYPGKTRQEIIEELEPHIK